MFDQKGPIIEEAAMDTNVFDALFKNWQCERIELAMENPAVNGASQTLTIRHCTGIPTMYVVTFFMGLCSTRKKEPCTQDIIYSTELKALLQ